MQFVRRKACSSHRLSNFLHFGGFSASHVILCQHWSHRFQLTATRDRFTEIRTAACNTLLEVSTSMLIRLCNRAFGRTSTYQQVQSGPYGAIHTRISHQQRAAFIWTGQGLGTPRRASATRLGSRDHLHGHERQGNPGCVRSCGVDERGRTGRCLSGAAVTRVMLTRVISAYL